MKIDFTLAFGLLVSSNLFLFAAERVKENNTVPLNAGASWVGGTAPTAADEGVWNSTVLGANSSALTNSVTWNGVKVTNPGGPVTVGGAGTLSLDGDAAPDINLTAATQDLTFEAPVAMAGATVTTDVIAGRTLTFAGPLAFTCATWSRTGLGTVVFDGPVTSGVSSAALELQRGTNILTGKFGGLSLSAAGSRIYVGRIAGAAGAGTLIVSNGFHDVRGTGNESTANFVGLSVRGNLVMEGGTLRMVYLRQGINGGVGDITVNGGTLDVTGGGPSSLASFALMIGNNHQDSAAASTASGTLTVNGGQALFTNGTVKVGSISAVSTGTQTVTLAGGVLAVRKFYVDSSVLVPKRFTLNGGTLRVAASGDCSRGRR